MRKRLTILVPCFQAILYGAVVAWAQIANHFFRESGAYVNAPLNILLRINVPIIALWAPVVYGLEWAASSSTALQPASTGIAGVGIAVFVNAAVLATIVAFWYGFAVEFNRRRRGDSLIRFKRRIAEVAKIAVFILAAMGCGLWAYYDWTRNFELARINRSTPLVISSAFGGAVMATWAILILKIAISDFRFFRRQGIVGSDLVSGRDN
jgi:hypothetical protein